MVVGLGNPGKKYQPTRHNIGFKVVDELCKVLNIFLKEKKFQSIIGKGSYKEKKLILAQPQTFMNRSGGAVFHLRHYFKINLSNLIVISDDLALHLGKIRIRRSGSAGGHNGLASIITEIKSQEFCRVRVGIGTPREGIDPADYVLEKFTLQEKKEVSSAIRKAAEAVLAIFDDGVEEAMNRFN